MHTLTTRLTDATAVHVLQPLHRVFRWARPATRPAVAAFWEGLAHRDRALVWSDENKRAWILRRLRTVVRQASRETAFYREHFAKAGFDPHADFAF